MYSPTTALLWQIWTRRRTAIYVVFAITLFSGVFAWVFDDTLRVAEESHRSTGFPLVAELLLHHLFLAWILLVLSIFNYTEFNPQKGSAGFPHRLFVLPVTSFRLVAVPMLSGTAVIGLATLMWRWILPTDDRSWVFPVGMAAWLAVYQSVCWAMPGIGSLRMVVLGGIAITFIALPFVFSMRTIPEAYVIGLFAGIAVLSFLGSWILVARQRSGGGINREWIRGLVEWLSDRLPRRSKPFSAAASAQFWFEWRRSGLVLPTLVAALLVFIVGPISWSLRTDPGASLRILIATLAAPIILALPVGKAFSKPDFWSGDLGVPTVIAVRPLSNNDIVWTKTKVAALSAAISWAVVLTFLSLWLWLWGDLDDGLPMTRNMLWQLFGQSLYPQYAIAALSIVAGVLLTWKFLIGNLWLGLSGRKAVFTVSALPYALAPVFGFIGLLLLERNEQSVFAWIRDNLNRLLPDLVWIAALALITKLWFAAFSWRKVPPQRARQYLLCWIGSSACLVSLAVLLSSVVSVFVPADIHRLKNVMILGALFLTPLARIGLAESALAKNRHRQ